MKRDIARSSLTIFTFALFLAGLVPAVHADDTSTPCSLATLKGAYSVQGQGILVAQLPGLPPPPLSFAEIAIDVIDGAGHITGRSPQTSTVRCFWGQLQEPIR
jgi:hypothetical protein